MPVIKITIRDRVATAPKLAHILLDNSDYVIAFNFDEEWEAYDTKTARFAYAATNWSTYADQIKPLSELLDE